MAVRPKTDAEPVPEQSVESSASGVEWAAITAGALAAVGVSIILFTLGSGLGLPALTHGHLCRKQLRPLLSAPAYG